MSQPARPRDVWKNPAAVPRPGPGDRRGGRRWVAAALVVVALGGGAAGLLMYLWPEPAPVVLALPVADYRHPDWPPDPWAEADARGFVDRVGGALAFQAQDAQPILRELNTVARDRRPAVVLLTALGVAEGENVYLLAGDRTPDDDPAAWLTLDEVLDPLRGAAAPRLLVLDVRPAADPRAVLAGGDVGTALDAALERLHGAGRLPFFVLSANTPAGGANVLRAVRRTAFGLALERAAAGEADGWGDDRRRDGRVSVRELAAYVRELTHHASTAAGLPAQLPRLHGAGADFDVSRVPRDGPPPRPAPDPWEYPKFLEDAWKERDAWLADGLHLRAPRVVRHLTLAASRAERHGLAGANPDTVRAAFDAPAVRLREARADPALGPVAPPAGSVARAVRKPGVNPAGARAALEPVFQRVRNLEPPGPKPDPKPDEGLARAVAAAWEKPPGAEPFDAAAAAIFSFARDLPDPTPDRMRHLATLAAGFKPRPPRHAELLTIGLIGELPPDVTRRWPSGTVRLLLEAAGLAEEAAAGDGADLPWVETRLAAADAARRDAVRDLCDPDLRGKRWDKAVESLATVRKDYEEVRDAAAALARARREYEETRAVLADVAASFPFESPAVSEEAAPLWAKLADDFDRVRKRLAPPAAPGLPDGGALKAAAQDLRGTRTRLLGLLRVPESAANVRQLEELLRWPRWSAADRSLLLKKLAEADRAAADEVLRRWPAGPSGREVRPDGPRGPAGVPEALGRWVTVLRLVDAPAAKGLEAELKALGPDPQGAGVAALGRKVRAATRRELAGAYATAGRDRQAATGWAVDPDDVPAYPQREPAGPPNPELPARRAAETEFHGWLGRTRYVEDAKALDSGPAKAAGAAAGYRDLGQAYQDYARVPR